MVERLTGCACAEVWVLYTVLRFWSIEDQVVASGIELSFDYLRRSADADVGIVPCVTVL